ncbi:MAG: zf-HC2 domain-containing protein [Abditibacteriales bacterium]|nr:zf-HC2 domain-containing protein [Abditibacteriales bacterium]MDW8367876.1 zf-HC2 domain-containing protein [Abditibacteriales bacterium]
MKCNKISNHLVAYALDELPPRERQRTQEHLAACASCRARLHAQERTLAALSHAPAPTPTPEMQRDLLRRLHQRQAEILEARRRKQERWETVLFGVTAAGVSSAVTFAGFTHVRVLLPLLVVLFLLGGVTGGLLLAMLAGRPRRSEGEP